MVLTGLSEIYQVLTLFSFAAKKAIWFVSDRYLQRAFQVTIDTHSCFHQLGNFEEVETHFSAVMFFDHVPSAVLDLLNSLQYVPQFIVVYMGALDFSKYNDLQQHQNIEALMQKVNKLVKAVDTHHADGFKGIFYSLMVSVPWYLGWQQQKAAHRAWARLNGALAKYAKLSGAYIIGHDGNQVQKGQGLYNPQGLINLSSVSNHMFMADILIKVEKVLLPFHTAHKASQVNKAMLNACQTQAKDLKNHMKNLSLH